jgi:hypothetical protein
MGIIFLFVLNHFVKKGPKTKIMQQHMTKKRIYLPYFFLPALKIFLDFTLLTSVNERFYTFRRWFMLFLQSIQKMCHFDLILSLLFLKVIILNYFED